ncbi:hypothetical protein ACH43Y_28795 [Streptomyces rubiginosohelvolus]|uniref:hypothetical protein n=1 Tax=Streptomyces rubiginosohelvolus TaxID=67362 RepID=UPI00378C850A
MDQQNLRTPAATTAITRQTRHALIVLATLTPGRRHIIQVAAEGYLSQVDRRRLPVGYTRPITDDRDNRADAYRMLGGDTLTRMLGISCRPDDARLPDTARTVLATVSAPVDRLIARAATTGQPATVALLHILGATDSDPDMDEALRRARAPRGVAA